MTKEKDNVEESTKALIKKAFKWTDYYSEKLEECSIGNFQFSSSPDIEQLQPILQNYKNIYRLGSLIFKLYIRNHTDTRASIERLNSYVELLSTAYIIFGSKKTYSPSQLLFFENFIWRVQISYPFFNKNFDFNVLRLVLNQSLMNTLETFIFLDGKNDKDYLKEKFFLISPYDLVGLIMNFIDFSYDKLIRFSEMVKVLTLHASKRVDNSPDWPIVKPVFKACAQKLGDTDDNKKILHVFSCAFYGDQEGKLQKILKDNKLWDEARIKKDKNGKERPESEGEITSRMHKNWSRRFQTWYKNYKISFKDYETFLFDLVEKFSNDSNNNNNTFISSKKISKILNEAVSLFGNDSEFIKEIPQIISRVNKKINEGLPEISPEEFDH